jgi:hypothetical protein
MNLDQIQQRQKQLLDELSRMDTESLRTELGRLVGLNAANFQRMAFVIRLLHERGEDLEELRLGVKTYLLKIAYGQMLPEVMEQFAVFPGLLQRVSNLSIPDQQRVLDAEGIKVASFRTDGTIEHRLAAPLKLSVRDLKQVFASDHIRNESEQISYLRSREHAALPAAKSPVTIDSRRRRLVITAPCTISRSELINFLARITD